MATEFEGISVLTEVPVLDDGIPLNASTKMYVNNEVKFRQISITRLLDWMKGQLTRSIYPVGSIYTTISNDNPGTLFGGTWERISGSFLLGSADGLDVGGTGGAATVTLTKAQMPSHTHELSSDDGAHTHTASMTSSGSHEHAVTVQGSGSHSHTPSSSSFNFTTNKSFGGTGDDVERVQVALSSSGRRAITAQNTNSLSEATSTSSNGLHTHDISVDVEGSNHTHNITVSGEGTHTHFVDNTGDGMAHENMPPYIKVNIWKRVS